MPKIDIIRIKALVISRQEMDRIFTEGALQMAAEQIRDTNIMKGSESVGKVIRAKVTEEGLEIEAEIEAEKGKGIFQVERFSFSINKEDIEKC